MYIFTYKSKLDNAEDTHLLALINPPSSGKLFMIHRAEVFSVGNAEFRVKLTEDYKVKGRTDGTKWINNVTDTEKSTGILVVDILSDGVIDDFLKIKTCLVSGGTEDLVSPDDRFIIRPGMSFMLKVAADNRFTMVGTNIAWEEEDIIEEIENDDYENVEIEEV